MLSKIHLIWCEMTTLTSVIYYLVILRHKLKNHVLCLEVLQNKTGSSFSFKICMLIKTEFLQIGWSSTMLFLLKKPAEKAFMHSNQALTLHAVASELPLYC